MARDTVGTVIERIRRQLASSIRMEINQLGVLATADATDTTITLAHDIANNVRSGSVLSMGGELMRVIGADPLTKECTVIRAWQDSHLEAHAAGVEVLVNPRFTRFDILDAIINELDSWSPAIFTILDYQFDVSDDTNTIELPATMAQAIGVIRVRQLLTGSGSTSWPELEFRLQRGSMGVWDAATVTGLAIRVLNGGRGSVGEGKILATVALPIDTSTLTETTNLSALGVVPQQLDVLELGVKYRLMGDDEPGRTGRTTQDEPRRTEETPPGSSLQVSGGLLQRYERRKGQEVMRLRSLYPMSTW